MVIRYCYQNILQQVIGSTLKEVERRIYYLHLSREGGMPGHTGPLGEAPGEVRRQKEEGSFSRSFYWGFHGKGKARAQD